MSFILDQIIAWGIKQMSGLLGVLNELIAAISIGLFSNEIINGFLTACQLAMNFFVVVGIAMWFFKLAKLREAGSGQILDHVNALVAGLIFSQAAILGMKWIYEIGMSVATSIGKLNMNTKVFEDDNLGNLFKGVLAESGVGRLFLLITLVFLIVELFKIFKQQIKRFPILIGHIPLAVAYLVSIFSGSLENMWSWCKSAGGVMISHIVQITFVIIGFNLMASNNVGNFLIGLGFILTSAKLDQLYGQWATSVQSSGYGSGMARVAHSAMLLSR